MKRAGILLILMAGFVSLPAFSMKKPVEEMTIKTSPRPLQHKTYEDLTSEREKLNQLIISTQDKKNKFLQEIEKNLETMDQTNPDYNRIKTFMSHIQGKYDKDVSTYISLIGSIDNELKARTPTS